MRRWRARKASEEGHGGAWRRASALTGNRGKEKGGEVGGELDGEAVRRLARAQRGGGARRQRGGARGWRWPARPSSTARFGASRRREGCEQGPRRRQPRSDRHRRVRGGAAAGGRDGRGSEETEGQERRREARRKRAGTKQSFYLTSSVKMNCLLDAVCGRPNDAFTVC